MSLPVRVFAAIAIFALAAACGTAVLTPSVQPAGTPAPAFTNKAQPLKAHTYSGNLYFLTTWAEMPGDSGLIASGTLFNPSRQAIGAGEFKIPRDSIALLEMNVKTIARPAGITGIAVWVTLLGTTAAICAIDPKGCFGSCPTFYTGGASQDRPDAEGFSGSVARSLEATDVDALPYVTVRNGAITLLMRNEALETHAVQSLRILAAPRRPGSRVFAGVDGRFHEVAQLQAPVGCSGEDGSCLRAVNALDGIERMRPATDKDLGRMENVDFEFAPQSGPIGLVLGARHSFVSTYLFYQTMGFSGRNAGRNLATLEREGARAFPGAFEMMRTVGSIEVLQMNSAGAWIPVSHFGEQGPLATDVQLVPLSDTDGSAPVRIRLRFAQGGWRLGYAALAARGAVVTPRSIDVTEVTREGSSDSLALRRLLEPERYLVTYPGDKYEISFAIPEELRGAEFFLESRGYYYEWMRSEWLADEDPLMLGLVALNPRAALKRLAPQFKNLEADLETQFWASRFGR